MIVCIVSVQWSFARSHYRDLFHGLITVIVCMISLQSSFVWSHYVDSLSIVLWTLISCSNWYKSNTMTLVVERKASNVCWIITNWHKSSRMFRSYTFRSRTIRPRRFRPAILSRSDVSASEQLNYCVNIFTLVFFSLNREREQSKSLAYCISCQCCMIIGYYKRSIASWY